MSGTEERESKTAGQLESELEERDKARRGREENRWKNLNQGYEDAGATDAKHAGINWGPSYKTRRKKPRRKG